MAKNPTRTFLTIIMDILVVASIALTVRLVVVFFGQLASQSWADSIVALTNPIVIPFGIEAIKTPYGGIFDASAAITIAALLVLEWVLSVIRSRA